MDNLVIVKKELLAMLHIIVNIVLSSWMTKEVSDCDTKNLKK